MASLEEIALAFRARLAACETLIGSFIKTPSVHAIEILGDVGFDFVVVDEEHAPFDRRAIDEAMLAGRAAGVATFVRVAATQGPSLLGALDAGAGGVLAPHVVGAAMARDLVARCRYSGGTRGFSNSPRAGRYGGRSLAEHVARADAALTIVAQIEDPSALHDIDALAQVDGVDALFVGRADLAVAMGESSPEAPSVAQATSRVCAAARAAHKPVMVFVNGAQDARAMRALGASAFVYASDQGLLRQAASAALRQMRELA